MSEFETRILHTTHEQKRRVTTVIEEYPTENNPVVIVKITRGTQSSSPLLIPRGAEWIVREAITEVIK